MSEHVESIRVDLSPFDQTGPRLYVHKFFCFEFPSADRQPEAIEHLEQRLSATILRWPFITGNIGPSHSDGLKNGVELRYDHPALANIERKILTVKHLTNKDFPWTWQQLTEKAMPPSVMDMTVLSSVPEWPESGKTYPVLAIQANFIPGGLLLCFAFHHTIADGASFMAFAKEFGAGLNSRVRADSVVDATMARRLRYEFAPGDGLRPLSAFPEYNYTQTPLKPVSNLPVTTRVLQFSASAVRALEKAINIDLKTRHGEEAWVSNIGCVSSLMWVAMIRARQARLNPAETVKMGVAVNVRSVMDPRLDEEYFGNVIVHTNATAKVSEFLDIEDSMVVAGISSAIPLAAVTLAAWRIREAVKGVNSKYVSDRLKTFSTLADPTEVSKAYERTMDNANTGIDFSSWRDQGADIEFNIPGTARSTVDFWRKAWSPNVGAYNILPRKGGSKGDALWEVSLGLSVEDMDRVCAVDELGGWVHRILE